MKKKHAKRIIVLLDGLRKINDNIVEFNENIISMHKENLDNAVVYLPGNVEQVELNGFKEKSFVNPEPQQNSVNSITETTGPESAPN